MLPMRIQQSVIDEKGEVPIGFVHEFTFAEPFGIKPISDSISKGLRLTELTATVL
jgi:hypothetical protein